MSGYCNWNLGKKNIPAFTSGGSKDTNNFLLVKATQDYMNVSTIQFSGDMKNPRVRFSLFWMGNEQYNGNSMCKFESRNPYGKKLSSF